MTARSLLFLLAYSLPRAVAEASVKAMEGV